MHANRRSRREKKQSGKPQLLACKMSKDNAPPGRQNSLVSMPHCSKGREWCALYVGEWEVRDILLPVGEIQGIVVKDMASCKICARRVSAEESSRRFIGEGHMVMSSMRQRR